MKTLSRPATRRASRALCLYAAVALALGDPSAALGGSPAPAPPPPGAAARHLAPSSPLPLGARDPRTFGRDAVDLEGALVLRFLDVSIPARGWALALARTYRSDGPTTELGPGWSWSFGPRVEIDATSNEPLVLEEDGRATPYAASGDGLYVPRSASFGHVLRWLPDRTFARISADGSVERFDRRGLLSERCDAFGVAQRIEREGELPRRVVDACGRALELEYESGRLVAVSDPLGRRTTYAYDGGRLSSVRDPLGRRTDYSYDEKGDLAGARFPDGATLSVSFDARGRVVRLVGPGGTTTRFDHDGSIDGRTRSIVRTDATGATERLDLEQAEGHAVLRFEDAAGEVSTLEARDGEVTFDDGRGAPARLELDPDGLPRRFTAHEGRTPPARARRSSPPPGTSGYDAAGNATAFVDRGERLVPEYDRAGRLVRLVHPGGSCEQFEYDAGDRLVRRVDHLGRAETFAYDAADRPIRATDFRGNVTTLRWDDRGLLASYRRPPAPELTFEYDAAGWLARAARGERSLVLRRDAAHRVAAVEDEVGNRETFEYGPGGALASTVDRHGRRLTLERDADAIPRSVSVEGGPAATRLSVGEDGTVSIASPLGAEQVVRRSGALARFLETPLGRTLEDARREDGRPLARRRPGLADETWHYDALGRLLAHGFEGSPGSRLEYGADGRLSGWRETSGLAWTLERDALGRVTRARSTAGEDRAYEYDALGDVKAVVSGRGHRVEYGYDHDGRVSEVRDGAAVTRYEYDDLGRLAIRRGPGASSARFAHDARGLLVEVVATEGSVERRTRHEYDRAGDLTRTTHPDGREETFRYDAAGRLVEHSEGGIVERLAYDALGRLVRRERGGLVEGREYDADGRVAAITGARPRSFVYAQGDAPAATRDGRGKLWREERDTHGNVTARTNPAGATTRFERAPSGEVAAVVDPAGRRVELARDAAGRIVSCRIPGCAPEVYGYDSRGDLVSVRRPGGAEVRYERDDAGRIVRTTVDGRLIARFTYDALGRAVAVDDEVGHHELAYDESGRLARATDAFGRTLAYSRDAGGHTSELVGPGGEKTQWTYENGRLASVVGPDGKATALDRDDAGRIATVRFPDATRAALSYGPDGRLSAVRYLDASQGVRAERLLERDGAGSVVASSDAGRRTTYEHDDAGKLTRVVRPDGADLFAYDAAGNLFRLGDAIGRDDAGRIARLGEHAVAYDADGNIARIEGVAAFAYDALGRLVRAERPGRDPVAFRYDYRGRLVETRSGESIARYLYSGGDVVGVYGGDGARQTWVERLGPELGCARLHDATGAALALVDGLGTPIGLVAATGEVTRFETSPWGRPITRGPPAALGFTGAPWDPTSGVVFLGRRAYFPELGQFLTPDPAIVGADLPRVREPALLEGLVAPYAYANDDPLRFTDRSGLDPEEPDPSKPAEHPAEPASVGPEAPRPEAVPGEATAPAAAEGIAAPKAPKLEWIPVDQLKYSQNSVKGRLDEGKGPWIDELATSMKEKGWDLSKGAVEGVRNPDGSVTLIDNTRLRAAKAAGLDKIPVNVHAPEDPLPGGVAARERPEGLGKVIKELEKRGVTKTDGTPFTTDNPGSTWGDLEHYRCAKQGRKFPIEGTSNDPRISPPQVPDPARGPAATRPMKPEEVQQELERLVREGKVDHEVTTRLRNPPARNDSGLPDTAQPRTGEPPAPKTEPSTPKTEPEAPKDGSTTPKTEPSTPKTEPTTPKGESVNPGEPGGSSGDHPSAGPDQPPAPPDQPSGGPERPSGPERPGGAGEATVPRDLPPDAPVGEGTPGSRPGETLPDPPARGGELGPAPGGEPARPTPGGELPEVGGIGGFEGGKAGAIEELLAGPSWLGGLMEGLQVAGVLAAAYEEYRLWEKYQHDSAAHSEADRWVDLTRFISDSAANIGFLALTFLGPEGMLFFFIGTALWKWFNSDPTFLTGCEVRPPRHARGGAREVSGDGPPASATVWLDRPASVRASVHRTDGSLVRDLGRVSGLAGPLRVLWDGTAPDGEPVPDGEYHILVDDARSDREPIPVAPVRAVVLVRNAPLVASIVAARVEGGRVRAEAKVDRPATALWLRVASDGAERALAVSSATTAPVLDVPARELGGAGPARLVVEARDAAGNTTRASADVTVPAPDPALVVTDVRVARTTSLELVGRGFGVADRAPAWLAGSTPQGSETVGAWRWTDGSHGSEGEGPDVHYVLAPKAGWFLGSGDNLVQYVRVDASAPPRELLIQLYGDGLDPEHRVFFGESLVDLGATPGPGLQRLGAVPPAGAWVRLRIPAETLGLTGRRVAGVLFATYGGRALWGTTTTSSATDDAPAVADSSAGRAEAEPVVRLDASYAALAPGALSVELLGSDGAPRPLRERLVGHGRRALSWSGPSALVEGARLRFRAAREGGTSEQMLALGDGGTPAEALVARIDFPPSGTIGRATVPIFGRAGGRGFQRFVVDYRPASAPADAPWTELARSERPSAISADEFHRIVDASMEGKLKRTIFGNLASLAAGSFVQRFEFRPEPQPLPPDRVVVRLRVFGKGDAVAEDRVDLLVGEVANNGALSSIPSPDGRARLELDPLSLPFPGAALAIERAPEVPPTGEGFIARGPAYRLAPEGIAFAHPARLTLAAPKGPRAAIHRHTDGAGWVPLETVERRDDAITVALDRVGPGSVYAVLERVHVAKPVLYAPPAAPDALVIVGEAEPGIRIEVASATGELVASTRTDGEGLFRLALPEGSRPRGPLIATAVDDASGARSEPAPVTLPRATKAARESPATGIAEPPRGPAPPLPRPEGARSFVQLQGPLRFGGLPGGRSDPEVLVRGPVALEPSTTLELVLSCSPGTLAQLIVRRGSRVDTLPLCDATSRDAASERRVSIPLASVLGPGPARIDEIAIGRVTAGGWRETALSGLSGSSTVEVEELWLGPAWPAAGPKSLALVYPDPGVRSIAWSIDTAPVATPTTTVAGAPERIELPPLASGLHWLHVRAVGEAAGPVAHWPLLVDRDPPRVSDPWPTPSSESGERRARIRIEDDGAGVDPASIRFEVGGAPVPARAVTFDPATGIASFAFGDLPHLPRCGAGEALEVVLAAVADRAGNALAKPFRWSWRFDPRRLAIGAARPLTREGGADPAWSPDGTRIAFVSDREGAPELFELEVASGKTTLLTHGAGATGSPSYSPDGARIAFARASGLAILERASGAITSLATSATDPAWLDAGTLLVARGDSAIALDLATGHERTLATAEAGGLVRRPRGVGAKLAFGLSVYNDSIWLEEGAGTKPRALSRELSEPSLVERDAALSPDGEWVAFSAGGAAPGLWLERPDASDRVALLPAFAAGDRRPAWSPDGRRIAFDSDRSGVRNVWLLELGRAPVLSVTPSVFSSTMHAPIAIALELEKACETRVAIAGPDGREVRELRPWTKTAPGPLALAWDGVASDRSSFATRRYAVLVEMRADGPALRTSVPVVRDDEPPFTRAFRSSDGREVGRFTPLSPQDLVLLRGDDGPDGVGVLRTEWRGEGETSWREVTGPLEPRMVRGGVLLYRSIDRFGQTEVERRLELGVPGESVARPETSPVATRATTRAPGSAAGRSLVWLLLLALGAAGAAVLVRASRRRRT